MPALWEGHEFSSGELAFWGQEILEAAIEVPDDERGGLVAALSAGSDRLRTYSEALLANSWSDRLPPAFAGSYRAGDVVRDCIILRPIGRGGMGEVYKAIQRPLRRLVAVKVVVGGPGRAPLLAREAANAARLLHPNIVSVYDADLDAARPCIVMEYVDGITLREYLGRLGREGRRPESAVVRSIVRQAALALGEAHRRGLIHRDVKPENILLLKRDTDHTVKVVDFGVARRLDTPAGSAVGTPGYIAPEVLNRAPSDARADLFALGVVIFEMLAGAHPFTGRSDAETCFNTVTGEPAFPDDPEQADLVAVARRALQRDPEHRYRSIEALLADLDSPPHESREPRLNPLLSELPFAAQQWWARRSSGFFVALLSFGWGVASLLLSVVLGAACVRVTWIADGEPRRTLEMIYGYAVEPNAGLWYVVGASICVLAGFAFLEATHRGLARTQTLSVDGGRGDPLANIARHNRRVFRFASPLALLIAVAFVGGPELVYRGEHAFGWVQADLAPRQVGETYDGLRAAGKIGNVPALASLCDDCPVRVGAVSNRTTGFEQPSELAFGLFLALALGHQMALMAFLIWLAAKILFFFGLMSMALVGEARDGLRFTPDLQDSDDYRFGLGQLDNVYYAMLVLVSAGVLGLFLQAAGNISKGTYFFAGDPAPALFGQAVLLLGTIALFVILVLTPIAVFLVLTIKAVGEELGRLSAKRKALDAQLTTAVTDAERARLHREMARVAERRALARKQSLLPTRQPRFLTLLAANLAMLLAFPLAIQWLGAPSRSGLPLTQRSSEVICIACGNASRGTR